jgi:hypothetical protein
MDTRIIDATAGATTLGTGLLNGEEALLHPHLAHAVAGGAGARLGAGTSAATAAVVTLHQGGDADLDLLARHRVFETEAEVITQVGAPMNAPATAPAAKDVAKNIAEDVSKPPGLAHARVRLDPGVAELVVGGAFLGVRQNLVG